tara:strand:+ start:1211 stop:1357 length:147 start_codon:yes stop_codon:yes gene_type:complete
LASLEEASLVEEVEAFLVEAFLVEAFLEKAAEASCLSCLGLASSDQQP